MIQAYHLADEFSDREAERAVLASLLQVPALYWEHVDLLSDAFLLEKEAWEVLSAAFREERPPSLPDSWPCAPEPGTAIQGLAELARKRTLADLQEQMARVLHSPRPSREVLEMFEETLARVRTTMGGTRSGSLQWGPELVRQYLSLADTRRQHREAYGTSIMGVTTGLRRLDELLNGLGTGLYILAGAPGVGKTTLALQMALRAAQQRVPVVYVTYENSPANLVGKALCASAGIPSSEVERGLGNLALLRTAEGELSQVMPCLAIVDGTSRLRVSEVRAHALQVMNRQGSERCLVVFDYLQRAAHGQGFEAIRHNVSALAGELRDLANRLGSPVLALSSQSRSGGNYGSGGGSASLDSLKESGDLEYSADVVMFLKTSSDRKAVPPARALDLVLGKNRFGDVGTVPLVFRADVGVLREEKR